MTRRNFSWLSVHDRMCSRGAENAENTPPIFAPLLKPRVSSPSPSKAGLRTHATATFIAKVRTGAFLFQHGYLDLYDAVDQLQGYAERAGLVRELGQDRVQQIIATAFEPIKREAL